ncbi:MAG: Pseudopilin GspJ [candidate division BRC1 bacterium ADurb.BinA292]|nr:MAG: Pseudopilin GspJ [candidate division BRC1 bacterium ADurb.BinA292]
MRGIVINISRRGLTLLELLVALAIFASLLTALFSAYWGGLRLREKAWTSMADDARRDHVGLLLRSDLRHLAAPVGVLAGPLVGEGQGNALQRADRLSFTSTTGLVSDAAPWGELQQVEYFLEYPLDSGQAEGFDFIRRTRRDLLATTISEDDIPGPEWRLLHGVRSLMIQYFDGEAWVDSWDSTTVENENPEAIRLWIEFVEAEAGAPPRPPIDLLVQVLSQPRASATASGAAAPAGGAGGGATPETPAGSGRAGGSREGGAREGGPPNGGARGERAT